MTKDKSDFFERQNQFLGKQIGRKFKFLARTSCMDQTTRIDLAGIEALNILLKDDKSDEAKEMKKFLNEIVIPTLENIGFAKWERDILTHLALRTALTTRKSFSLGELTFE